MYKQGSREGKTERRCNQVGRSDRVERHEKAHVWIDLQVIVNQNSYDCCTENSKTENVSLVGVLALQMASGHLYFGLGIKGGNDDTAHFGRSRDESR